MCALILHLCTRRSTSPIPNYTNSKIDFLARWTMSQDWNQRHKRVTFTVYLFYNSIFYKLDCAYYIQKVSCVRTDPGVSTTM
ncbi:hypothetical protein GDO81_029148 [Engystomops pustulosus]|uniref:Uncharacterized protein n=1 Tax=Engystomops pustulosus TaxID=76066 RepID=A0AAV6Z1W4_ENGPU|nr:hypothetical protein GDO81_029148 [Engystomops pustulosus]